MSTARIYGVFVCCLKEDKCLLPKRGYIIFLLWVVGAVETWCGFTVVTVHFNTVFFCFPATNICIDTLSGVCSRHVDYETFYSPCNARYFLKKLNFLPKQTVLFCRHVGTRWRADWPRCDHVILKRAIWLVDSAVAPNNTEAFCCLAVSGMGRQVRASLLDSTRLSHAK